MKGIQDKTIEVEKLQNELEMLAKLVEYMYKILIYIEIPLFKKDRKGFYEKLINNIIRNEKKRVDNTDNLNELLNQHLGNIIEIFKSDNKDKSKLRNFR